MKRVRFLAYVVLVLLIRTPLMLPLLVLYGLGRWADRALEWLSDRLPGL